MGTASSDVISAASSKNSCSGKTAGMLLAIIHNLYCSIFRRVPGLWHFLADCGNNRPILSALPLWRFCRKYLLGEFYVSNKPEQ